MAQIFLSYSHKDGAFVRTVADGLSAEGYSLWWDRALKPSDDYTIDIEKQLEASKCVVVVWSNTARNSLWVRAEANAALEYGKLIQVAAEPTRPPLPFTMLHLLDLSKWRGSRDVEEWRSLTGACNAVLAGGTAQVRPASKASAPSMFAPMIAVGAGSIGLVGLTSALAIAMTRTSDNIDILGVSAFGTFAAACLGLGYMLIRTIEIGLASRRPA